MTSGPSGTLDVNVIDAVESDGPKIIILSGTISGDGVVKVGWNTPVIGESGSRFVLVLNGMDLRLSSESNVIIGNVAFSKVLASAGDIIGVQAASKVWADHCDLCSNRDHDKVFTYALSYGYNIDRHTPSFRFGRGHTYNSFFLDVDDGINIRDGAPKFWFKTTFSTLCSSRFSASCISTGDGYAAGTGDVFSDGSNAAEVGDWDDPPYLPHTFIDASREVYGTAGQILNF
ncbi:pectin lyase-like protein [Fistulina hepatica ATCC 64428]|uniref:Pectin lyase-like protein n=1 Tax=Fistulina hepatica ATCC 64428 TaxID=1128425 RepID=A0A0D7AFN6_9AGAR|nr:pectin lyase-like protein [Fistulina hepatica ATCC 64428]